jgi:phosphatidylinositol 4-kinase type 2
MRAMMHKFSFRCLTAISTKTYNYLSIVTAQTLACESCRVAVARHSQSGRYRRRSSSYATLVIAFACHISDSADAHERHRPFTLSTPTMPKKGRPATSGYAKIAQAEEEEEDDYEDEDDYHRASLSNTQYAPIQPKRDSRMRMPVGSSDTSPNLQRTGSGRPRRSNSGVDIKAINARFERWAEEIAQKFKIKRSKERDEEEPLEIHHSVFQAPDWVRPTTVESLTFDHEDSSDRMTGLQFDDIVESVKVAIEMGTHPKLITQGSSGSYFARNTQGKVVGVFKPKDEEPYASRNPKWTKWIHRNLFPFFFGRACLIPNLSYVSEAAAYVLDTQLRTNLVPYTDIVGLSSKSFHYDFWDRRAYYRKKKPFPEKVGSFQVFLKGFKDANIFLREHPWPDQHGPGTGGAARKKKRRWAEECRPSGTQSDNDEDEEARPGSVRQEQQRREFWTDGLQQSFREQLEKLVILDYIMRNTDRGLDNWMVKIDEKTQQASIVMEPPKLDRDADGESQPSHYTRQSMSEVEQYRRQEPMRATGRSMMPMENTPTPAVSIGAIDNSLSWPWKHPDAVSTRKTLFDHSANLYSGEAILLVGSSSLSPSLDGHFRMHLGATSSLY